MMYIRYTVGAVASLLFKLFCWLPVVSIPSALVAAAFNLDRLPPVWRWVMTHDDDIYGSKTRRKHMDDSTGKPDRFFARFKLALWWLYRNPGYGFAAFVLGYEDAGSTVVQVDQYRWQMTDAKGREYFSYFREIPLTKRLYIKTWFGWHFKNQAGWHMLKIDFTPKRYEPK